MRVQWTERALLSFERTATYIFEYFVLQPNSVLRKKSHIRYSC